MTAIKKLNQGYFLQIINDIKENNETKQMKQNK